MSDTGNDIKQKFDALRNTLTAKYPEMGLELSQEVHEQLDSLGAAIDQGKSLGQSQTQEQEQKAPESEPAPKPGTKPAS